MNTTRLLALAGITVVLAACESGDVNLSPTNIDNSTGGGGGGGGGANNPCASYTIDGTTRQGTFDGTNCTYNANFVSETNPLLVDVLIPFFSGVHIFQNSLVVGQDVSSGPAPIADGSGPDLIIEAGATLAFSDAGDYVLINRGSQIIAEGSASAPITFTGFTDAVSGTAGPFDVQLWGGIVINGNGITNNCTDEQRATNSCHVESEGRPSFYGGNDNAESSGVLRYVVVKHTGFEVAPGDELNGITFNAVGSGTVVENVQIYSTYDDGVEFFGGAVNVSNLVAMYVRDDSIDFSDGYVGTIDKALIIHPPLDGNRCVEGDNIGESRLQNTSSSLPPISKPTIRHMTCLTSNMDAGTHGDSEGPILRFGARAIITDSIIEGRRATASAATAALPSNECLDLDTATTPDTVDAAAAGETTINNTVIACQEPTAHNLTNGDSVAQWVLNQSAAGADYSFNANNLIVTAAEPAAGDNNGRVLQADTFYSFDADSAADTVTILDAAGVPIVIPATDGFIGAVTSGNDWTANWTYGIAPNNRGADPWWDLTP